jgi:hypothetical protein
MKILFLSDRVVDDRHRGTPAETRFDAGAVYDLAPQSAQHWLNRGVATADPIRIDAAVAAMTKADAEATEPADPITIPDTWADLPWAELRALASAISGAAVANKAAATAVIEAEMAKRAAASRTDGVASGGEVDPQAG